MYSAGSSRQGAYTLLELLLVLAIVVAVATVAVPRFAALSTTLVLQEAARDCASLLRYARARSVALAESVPVDARANDGHLLAPAIGRELTLPDKLHFADAATIHFYPDGSSSGGRLRLAADERELAIDVDWLTGQVKVH